MRTRVLLLAVIATGLAAAPARAQLCDSRPSFTNGTNQLSLLGDVRDLQSLAAQYAFGEAGAYGHFAVGRIHLDRGGSAFDLAAGAGQQIVIDRRGLWQVCPIASVTEVFMSDVDIYGDGSVIVDARETDYSLGLTVGAVTSRSQRLQVVQSGSLSFVTANVHVQDSGSGASGNGTEYFGLLGLAFAVIMDRTFAVRSSVVIPLGLKGASSGYGITLSLNFGRRLPPPE